MIRMRRGLFDDLAAPEAPGAARSGTVQAGVQAGLFDDLAAPALSESPSTFGVPRAGAGAGIDGQFTGGSGLFDDMKLAPGQEGVVPGAQFSSSLPGSGGGAPARGRDAAQGGEDQYSRGLTRVLHGLGGAAGTAMRVLDTPRSVLAATVGAATGQLPLSDIAAAARMEKNVSWGDLLPEMTIGRSSVPTGMNVLGATMEQLRGGSAPDFEEREDLALTPWVGFAADVFLDPLNLLGVGMATKLGKSSKLLTSVVGGVESRHLDAVAPLLGFGGKRGEKIVALARSGDEAARAVVRGRIVRALGNGDGALTRTLIDKGYSRRIVERIAEAAKKGTELLGETLVERAAKGQWAAGSFAGMETPKAFNKAVAKGLAWGKKTLADSPAGTGRFLTWTGNEAADRAIREVDLRHRMNEADILDSGTRLRRSIDELPEEAFGGRSSADWFERVGGVKGQTAIGEIDARQAAMVREVAELQSRQAEEMARRGILGKTVEEAGYAYVPHVAREESLLQRMKMSVSGHGGRPSVKTPHALQREYRWIRDAGTGKEVLDSVSRYAETTGKSVDEVLAASRQASVDEINGALGRKLFSGDLAEAVTVAALRNERALHGARQIETFLEQAGKRVEDLGGVDAAVKAGWRPPRLQVPARFVVKDGEMFPVRDKIQMLQKTPMEPSLRRLVEGRWKTIAQPEATLLGMRKMWSGYMGVWKRYTLFPFLEYHTRNVVGDLWNGWMQGWKPSEMTGDLLGAAALQRGKDLPISLPAYGKLRGPELLDAARRYGVIGTGQYGELLEEVVKPIASKEKGWFRKHFWDLDVPVKVGSFLEDNRRLAFFTRRLREGDTFDEAARVVAKTLYDYGDLTDLERQIRTFAIPFYSFYRKNLPAQVENLIRHPGKMAILPKGKAHLEKAWGTNPEDPRDQEPYNAAVPDWMEANLPIRWRKDANGYDEFFVLGNWIPSADLFRFVGDPKALVMNVVGNLNPPIQKVVEHVSNRDLFGGRPLDVLRDEAAGIFEEGGMLRGNARTNFLGQSVRTTTASLSDLLPVARLLSTLDRLNPGGVFDVPGYSGRGAAGQKKTRPYHTEMGGVQKWVKLLTGLKSYPVDTQMEMLYDAMGLMRAGGGEGLTVENVRKMLSRAALEKDQEAMEHYGRLLDLLLGRLKGRFQKSRNAEWE